MTNEKIINLKAVIKYVHAIAGSFFLNATQGNRYFDDEVEHFRLNVVDTPGFGDTDKDWFLFFALKFAFKFDLVKNCSDEQVILIKSSISIKFVLSSGIIHESNISQTRSEFTKSCTIVNIWD